jgi:6-phosphogluconolactonase
MDAISSLLVAGDYGHTASFFPGSEAQGECSRLAVPVHPAAGRPGRVTLTLPVLNNAAHMLVLVSGPSKATVVQEIFTANGRTSPDVSETPRNSTAPGASSS